MVSRLVQTERRKLAFCRGAAKAGELGDGTSEGSGSGSGSQSGGDNTQSGGSTETGGNQGGGSTIPGEGD